MKAILIFILIVSLKAETKYELLTTYGIPLKIVENQKFREEVWYYTKRNFKFIDGVYVAPEVLVQEVKRETKKKNVSNDASGLTLFKAFQEADRKSASQGQSPLSPNSRNPVVASPPVETEFQQELVE